MQFSSSHLAIPFILALALLSGCSGGGSSSSAPAISSQAPPPPQPSGTPAVATSFEEQAVMRGLSFGFGFSTSMNEMVRLFAGGAASGDVDGDGDIDLFIVRGDLGPNLLYINEGGMSFREAAGAAGLAYTKDASTNYRHSGPTFADLNGDGNLDLFIGGLENDPSLIFLNDGTGTFTDVTTGSGIDRMDSIHTISAAFGDYDRDGDLDIAMAHWGTPRNSVLPGETETLWRNDSDASGLKFVAVSGPAGISAELKLDSAQGVLGTDHDYTFAPSFADINDDGYPDLLSVADFGGSRIFINQQDGTFERATYTPD
ncbi:MAG: VCBS repeat-containing protein, partial [Pseudomonadota bacterium]